MILTFPIAALFAARGSRAALARPWAWVKSRGKGARAAFVVFGLALLWVPGFPLHGIHKHRQERSEPHPYAVAFNWIQSSVEEGSTIINDGEIVPLHQSDVRVQWVYRADRERAGIREQSDRQARA